MDIYTVFLQLQDGVSLPKISKNLDPSYKTDLNFYDCFGRKTPLFCSIS